jgi:hypothetical protein
MRYQQTSERDQLIETSDKLIETKELHDSKPERVAKEELQEMIKDYNLSID